MSAAELLVDPVCGLITDVHRMPPDPDMPSSWVGAGAHVARADRWADWRADGFGFGATLGDETAARAAAVGEAVERYCGNAIPAHLTQHSWNQLAAAGTAAIDPTTLALYSPTQHATPGFPFVPFTRDLHVAWAPGRDLHSGQQVLVPASLTWLDYFHGERRNEPHTHALMYSGIAAGPDIITAADTALLELLERDATAIWWASGGPVTRLIDHGAVTGRLGRPGAALHLTLLAVPSPFGIPVVAAFIEDRDRGLVAFGSACRTSEVAAATKALVEALGVLQLTRQLDDPDGAVWQAVAAGEIEPHVFLPYRADRRYLDGIDDKYRRLTDLPPVAQLYMDPRMRIHLDRLKPAASRALDTATTRQRSALNALSHQGIGAVAVDLTTTDIAQAGLSVVRVVAPGLIGNGPPAFPLRGGSRLYTEPHRLGFTDAALTEAELVRSPLPMA